MKRKKIMLGKSTLSDESPPFIIAEAGVNHNGDITIAKELIYAAKDVGANAVKFQGFTAEGLCDLDLTETKNVETLTGGTKSSYDMYKRLELSNDDIVALKNTAEKCDILFFLSVFDCDRISFLTSIDMPCFKISSGDLTYHLLLSCVAETKKPVLLSTGLACMEEVTKAVRVVEETSNNDIIIMQCTADYPPKDEEVNLKVIQTFRKTFNYPIGFSDHSTGIELSLAAITLGAAVIEKHFTLDHEMNGPDHQMSCDPKEMKALVRGAQRIFCAKGSSDKKPTAKEKEELLFTGRRGIKAARDLKAGEILTAVDVKCVKPASGITPEYLNDLIGKKLKQNVAKNIPLEWASFE